MSNVLNPWFMIGAAVVGIVSAAGVILGERLRQDRRRQAMSQDLARMNNEIVGLKAFVEQLRIQYSKTNEAKVRRHKRRPVSTLSSASEMDSSDMEFYDVSDEETTNESIALKDLDEEMEEASKIDSVLEQLVKLQEVSPTNTEILWRIGKAYYKLALKCEDVDRKLVQVNKGISVCKSALELKPNCGESHKWFAILTGTLSDHQGLRDKIHSGIEFKNHLDTAIELLPDDSTLYHLLGRYNYEIASLKWYERKTVAALYEELPACTYEQAIEQLRKAEALGQKDWKENKLALGRCHIALGDYKRAVAYLDAADAIDNDANPAINTEIKSLLSKYSGYR